MKRLFGTDGIRGIINEELTAELALKLGNAIGRFYTGKYDRLIIAKDTRSSGDLLESAIASGATSAGMSVEFAGVIPTPALAYLTIKHRSLGVVISASHNPAVYNGIKVLAAGMKISDEDEVEIENLIIEKPFHYTVFSDVGRTYDRPDYRHEYIEYIVDKFSGKSFGNYPLLVDGANGAISTVISDVYSALGIKAAFMNTTPDGININDSCGSMHPEITGNMLSNSDTGILFDGDADRCLFVLPGGQVVDGDILIAANARKMIRENRLNNMTVVTTVMSNLGFEKYLQNIGVRLLRTRVGDKYVLERMLQSGSVLGGEQSGHIIFLDRGTTGDGLVTSLETLNTLAILEINLNDFVTEIPVYPQILKNVPVSDKKGVIDCKKLKDKLLLLETDDTIRVVLRPSGTEPYIRVMVEGTDSARVNAVCQELVETVEECNY